MARKEYDSKHVEHLLSMLKADADAFERSGGITELLNELFLGYPVEALREVVTSEDSRVRRVAVRVLSELGDRAEPLLNEVIAALQHLDDYIRYYALDAIMLSTEHRNQEKFWHVISMLDDGDRGVRQKALRFLATASDQQIASAITRLEESANWSPWCPGLRLLLRPLSVDDVAVMAMIRMGTRFEKQLGVAISARAYSRYPQLLRFAAQELDEELKSVAAYFLDLTDGGAPTKGLNLFG